MLTIHENNTYFYIFNLKTNKFFMIFMCLTIFYNEIIMDSLLKHLIIRVI